MGIIREVYKLDSLLNENYIIEKYSLSYQVYGADLKSFNKLIKKGICDNISKNELKNNLKSSYMFIECEDLKFGDIEVKGKFAFIYEIYKNENVIDIDIYADSMELLTAVQNLIFKKTVEKFLSKGEYNIGLYKLSANLRGELESNFQKLNKNNFKDIDSDYYPYIDIDKFMTEFLTTKENILILSGKQGLGKTKFNSLILKKALTNYKLIKKKRDSIVVESLDDLINDEHEIKVLYVKNEDILAREDFWQKLNDELYDFVFLDDLDYMLLPRTREVSSDIDISRSKFINQMLSFTDGIVPTHTKFIITSNKIDSDIDPALRREGRMFDILTFKELSFKEARNIWLKNKLSEKLFKKHFNKNDKISHSKLGTLIDYFKKSKSKKVKSYLKDSDISKLSVGPKKDLGF